jgi:ParB family transcriptional regulator, chromosome partitioning protein
VAKRGLPETVRMRHDAHYVEALTGPGGVPVGRMVPIDLIDPNPNQPRQVMGDLSELMASIAEKGIIEPIIVRRRGQRFQIIAGERRYQAAVQVGLTEVPAVIRDVDDMEVIEIALIENLQRKDLTPFEEAEALAQLSEHGLTHDQLAKRVGRSRTAITETLALNQMPEDVRNLCRLADIHSKSLLLQIVRQSDHDKMLALIERVSSQAAGEQPVTREQLRTASPKPKAGRPRAYVFQYRPKSKAFSLRLNFRKSDVETSEVIDALLGIIEELRLAKRHA